MIYYYRYLFVKMKVFNYSELHFAEVTFYKIHTLIIFTNILNRGDCKGDQEWNCKCVSQNDVEVDADISDVEYENFDA